MDQEHRKQVERVIAKELVDTSTRLCVQVWKTVAHVPRYSFEIGQKIPDQRNPGEFRFVRFFQFFARSMNAKIEFNPTNTHALVQLIQSAEGWMHHQTQMREDEILAEKQRHEQDQLDRDRPKHQPGLKSLSKRDKEKRRQEQG